MRFLVSPFLVTQLTTTASPAFTVLGLAEKLTTSGPLTVTVISREANVPVGSDAFQT